MTDVIWALALVGAGFWLGRRDAQADVEGLLGEQAALLTRQAALLEQAAAAAEQAVMERDIAVEIVTAELEA